MKIYRDAARDLSLDENHNLNFLYILFDEESKIVYGEIVQGQYWNFNEAQGLMSYNYRIISNKNRVRKYLQKIRLDIIEKHNNCPIRKGLEELLDKFEKAPHNGLQLVNMNYIKWSTSMTMLLDVIYSKVVMEVFQ